MVNTAKKKKTDIDEGVLLSYNLLIGLMKDSTSFKMLCMYNDYIILKTKKINLKN